MKTFKQKGFTLLETLLVLAILGGVMVLALNYGTRQVAQQRRDKTALQIQHILNAGLAYYTTYGTWPVPSGTCNFASNRTNNIILPSTLATLTASGYLPSAINNNAFGYPYSLACDNVTGGVFYVITEFNNRANALIVAGEVPVAYLSDRYGNPSTSGLFVTSQVATPGQNLNNARSINFAGTYHHGACVPVPACPGYNAGAVPPACNSGTNCMTPQIMVAPASVSGLENPSPYPTAANTYPITSFTAYALGPSTAGAVQGCPGAPAGCSWGAGIPYGTIASPTGLYWRVCLQVATERGVASGSNWGRFVSMVVMTRCTPPSEPYGSDFSVFTP